MTIPQSRTRWERTAVLKVFGPGLRRHRVRNLVDGSTLAELGVHYYRNESAGKQNHSHHVRAGEPHWRSAALGGHGFGQSGPGVTRALLRGSTSQTRHYGQCDQSWMDGE
jgi:hypothetical protein